MSVITNQVMWDQPHAHGFFKYSNRTVELIKYPYLNLDSNIWNFKNVQKLGMTSYWSCKSIYKFGAFIKMPSYFILIGKTNYRKEKQKGKIKQKRKQKNLTCRLGEASPSGPKGH